MNKTEFVNSLRKSLNGLSEAEVNEIVYDYEEHFAIGSSAGKTEEEISLELGDPLVIAKQYSVDIKPEVMPRAANETSNIGNIFKGIGMFFFNLIFVLGPAIAAVAIVFSFFCIGGALVLAGGVAIISPVLKSLLKDFIDYGPFNVATVMLLGIFFGSTGILIIGGSARLSEKLRTLFLKYAMWNVKVVKKGAL